MWFEMRGLECGRSTCLRQSFALEKSLLAEGNKLLNVEHNDYIVSVESH